MKTKTITGTYGSNETETEIYVYTDSNGLNWYACDDSVNVNATCDDLEDGVNVELVEDSDTSTAQEPICSEEDLKRHMSDDEEGLGFEYVIDSWSNGQKKQAVLHIDECGNFHGFLEFAESEGDKERVFAIAKHYAFHHGL
jgi:hypothetical protein